MPRPDADKTRKRALRTGDKVLIGAIALCALVAGGLWIAQRALPVGGDGPVVVCQTREGFRRVDPLDAEVAYTVSGGGGSNTVAIDHGSVDVTWSDCSNQICVDHAPITRTGEQIVCLPHGMVVEIVADEKDAATLM